jgi:hypothetical protein
VGVIRRYDESDARRDALVEAMKRHVRAARPDTDYDADIEYIEHAIVAFTDEQLQGAVEALRALDADLSLLESGADQPGTVGSEWVRERLRPIIAAVGGQ